MNFDEQVTNEFLRRIKSGMHIGQAVNFHAGEDFPNVSEEELAEFCSRWYVNNYQRGNFALKRQYAEDILEENGFL